MMENFMILRLEKNLINSKKNIMTIIFFFSNKKV